MSSTVTTNPCSGLGTKYKELLLSNYDISEKTGFLPENPLRKLPGACFHEWEELANQLPQFIREKRVKKEVDLLPKFDEHTLTSEAEWRRAYVLLSFIGQAYIWMEGNPECPEKILPRKIAVPWDHVSKHIGVPPVLTYATVVLYNYSLIDPAKPLQDKDNLRAVSTFIDHRGKPGDECGFYMVHVNEEFAAAPGLKAIENAYRSMGNHQNDSLAQDLQQIAETLKEMIKILEKMSEKCDPEFFFRKLRPYLGGSINLPDGIIYEGVNTEPKKLRGGSGAQDSAIPAFDIFLGATHQGNQKDLDDFKKYMPQKHREFLEELSTQPSVRDYVKNSSDAELIKCYNKAVEALSSFRETHLSTVEKYIIDFLDTGPGEAKGTGGTKISEFLKCVREDAEKLKINID